MAAPAWVTARPVAHRGLHDPRSGVIENSLEAADAAARAGYAVECDVTLSADGEAMVFHDDTLDRLTDASGPVAERSAAALTCLTLRGGQSTIPTLPDLLATLGGRVPLICEIKSRFDADLTLARRVAEIAASYAGPLAFKSFDPAIVAAMQGLASDRPRGIVAETRYDDPEWGALPPQTRASLRSAAFFQAVQPDFLSWFVEDLETPAPTLARQMAGLPVMTWTVRTPEDLRLARAGADQIVFEGFRP